MHALQRVIDSGVAALDQGAHSPSSIDMAVLGNSSRTAESEGLNGGTDTGSAAPIDPELELHRTAALYESMATTSSPA